VSTDDVRSEVKQEVGDGQARTIASQDQRIAAMAETETAQDAEIGRLDAAAATSDALVAELTAKALVRDARIAELVAEVEGLTAAMERRAVIEQAKGVIMSTMQCGPDAAFAVLVAQSQRENRKLSAIAAELAAMQDRRS